MVRNAGAPDSSSSAVFGRQSLALPRHPAEHGPYYDTLDACSETCAVLDREVRMHLKYVPSIIGMQDPHRGYILQDYEFVAF